jgi:hypothetical protein
VDAPDEQTDPFLNRVRRMAEDLSAADAPFSFSAVDEYLIKVDTRPNAPELQSVVQFFLKSTYLCETVLDDGRVVQLQPALACKWLYAIWDPSTGKLVQLEAFEPKEVNAP